MGDTATPSEIAIDDPDLEHLLDDDPEDEEEEANQDQQTSSTPVTSPSRSSDLTNDDSIPSLTYTTESDSGNSSVNAGYSLEANQERVKINSEKGSLSLYSIDSHNSIFRILALRNERPASDGTYNDSLRLDNIINNFIPYLSTIFINLFIEYSVTNESNVFLSNFDLKVE